MKNLSFILFGRKKLFRLFTGVSLLGLVLSFHCLLVPSAGSAADLKSTFNSVNAWFDFERFYLDPKVTSKDLEQIDPAHRPTAENWFDLPTIWVPESEMDIASLEETIPVDIKNELIRTHNGVRYCRLFIHPESVETYKDQIQKYGPLEYEFNAMASSSTRSLRVQSKKNKDIEFIAKVSLEKKFWNVNRSIPSDEVVSSIGITKYLVKIKNGLPEQLQFMPEVFGAIPKSQKRGGQIIRLIPEEVRKNKVTLMPLFAFYGKDSRYNGQESFLSEIAKKAGISPYKFIHDKVLKPFLWAWADYAVNSVSVMEAHGQNILIELDRNFMPTGRFYFRDMGAVMIYGLSRWVDQKLLLTLPVFSSFADDYNQHNAEERSNPSVSRFFRNGFLYNIDLELKKIDSSYVQGQIFDDFFNELRNIFLNYGLKPKELTRDKLNNEMTRILESARHHHNNKQCGSVFQPGN